MMDKAIEKPVKELLNLPAKDWRFAIIFMLSLSAVGLSFFPAWLLVAVLLINRWKKDRYDFLIMIMIMATSAAFIPDHVLPIKLSDPLLVLSIIGLILCRRFPELKKITIATAFYCAYLLLMSTFSDETLGIQLLTIRQYIAVIAFFLPIWFFANREFDIIYFFKKVVCYFLIICAFYFLDGFVFQGWILIPASSNWGDFTPTFFNPVWSPLGIKGSWFPRKWPMGCYIILLAAYPLSRYFRLKWWQWAIIFGAFLAMRTMTVIAAFALVYIIYQGTFFKVMKYVVGGLFLLILLYLADGWSGNHMRIASTIDQFVELSVAQDEEDVSQFGSSRMAQIIPKWDALVDQGCVAQGFGFIHPTLTTNPRYEIRNELYVNIELADENAAFTEVTQFNTILHIGIIGLILQAFYYFGIYFFVKRAPDAPFYISSLVMASVMGLGGFTGLNASTGLLWIGTALGVVLLQLRPNKYSKKLRVHDSL